MYKTILLCYIVTWVKCLSHSQQYNYQDDDSPPHDQGFLRLTNEVTPELVHVSEKNLSEIENVHGYVSHSHISPLKVSITRSRSPPPLPSLVFFDAISCILFGVFSPFLTHLFPQPWIHSVYDVIWTEVRECVSQQRAALSLWRSCEPSPQPQQNYSSHQPQLNFEQDLMTSLSRFHLVLLLFVIHSCN